jgi:HlyD family secretion protein
VKRALIATGVLVALAAIVAGSFFSGERGKKGTEVYAEPARRTEIAQIIKASGRIDPRVKVDISAHVIGKIEQLYVEEGDEIKAGQPFLRLEQQAFTAARDRALAQLEIARSRLRQAEINLEDNEIRRSRARRLHQEGVLSREGLDQAELAYKSDELALEQAKESVHQARAELEQAEDDLRKTTIYAPLSGRVITLNAEEGEVVVSGTMNNAASVIGTIADLSEILVEVDVDENEIVFVRRGQPVDVIVDAVSERMYEGSVVEIGSSGSQRSGPQEVTSFKVKVLLDRPDEQLRPGMSARAEIEVDRRPGTLTVPIQAVVYRPPPGIEDASAEDEIKVVFVARERKAVQTPVEVGISDATNIEILGGIEEGVEVITGPYRTLRNLEDGDAIEPKAAPGSGRDADPGEAAEEDGDGEQRGGLRVRVGDGDDAGD